jgi:ubiquinol-cytochrome c reductase cytochrome b/c1 subunit
MASHESTYRPTTRFGKWLDARLPIARLMYAQFVEFPTPRNLNYFWTTGGLLTFFLAVQIMTGVVLAMHYVPTASDAFNSIEHIRRDVNYGWLIRNLHAVGSSMFFLAVYIHIGRGLYYGSYKAPREMLWILGVVIFLLMMATAFMGYSLPWGQMSFWAVTVITNLFSSVDAIIPGLGTKIVQWLWGGYAVSGTTLTRFFSLHYLLPWVIAAVVGLHIWALHVVGQNNPTGLDIKTSSDSVPMLPYAVMKDAFALAVFVVLFVWFAFYLPDYLGHADNYIEANPLSTPPHIVPEWYFLPYYAILRAIPNKLLGVIAMFSSVLLLCFVPWLDTSRVRSAKYRPLYKWFFWLFIITTISLGYLGSKPPEGSYVAWARVFTAYYFLHFLVVMPIVGVLETPSKMPRSITESVLGTAAKATAVIVAAALVTCLGSGGPAHAAEGGHPAIQRQNWTFAGMFGKFDAAQLQRGFKVYTEVCSRCHGIKRLSFRNLAQPGGPSFPEAAVKSLAATYQIDGEPNEQNKVLKRPAVLSDAIPSPYKNDQEARYVQNGALPPDLSLVAKARSVESMATFYQAPLNMLRDIIGGYQEGGADYLYAYLTGYAEKPSDMKLADTMNYNAVFLGNQTAMPNPFIGGDGLVKYDDGTPATVDNYARDVVAFLAWAADPKLDERKRLGLLVLGYLLVTAVLLYFAKRRIWSSAH